jgi:hypothetical protein
MTLSGQGWWSVCMTLDGQAMDPGCQGQPPIPDISEPVTGRARFLATVSPGRHALEPGVTTTAGNWIQGGNWQMEYRVYKP